MDFSKLLDAIKLSPKYLIPLFLACGFLLFAPADYTAILGLDLFVSSYRSWIGLAFLVSSTLLLSHLFISGWSWARKKYEARKSLNDAYDRLKNLTPDEKVILRGYIFNQTKTQVLDMMDGVVNGLVHAGIIYQASNLGSLIEGFAYNIQPWVWDFLNKNKHLLEVTQGENEFVRSSPMHRSRRTR